VHRPEADETLAHVEFPDEFHHGLGEVDELDALLGLDDQGFAVNRQAANRRRCHLLDRLLADSHGRTLAHSVLSVCGVDCRVPLSDKGTQCYEKTTG
jgi:hypothetical protein